MKEVLLVEFQEDNILFEKTKNGKIYITGVYSTFENGVLVETWTDSKIIMNTWENCYLFGNITGNFEEIRITKSARWSTNFIPPNNPS